MAGIFFEVFALLTILAFASTFFSFWKQNLSALLFPVFLFVLSGGILLSQGLAYESGSVFDSATGIVSYSFSTVTASNDLSVLLTGSVFVFFGLFLALKTWTVYAGGGEF